MSLPERSAFDRFCEMLQGNGATVSSFAAEIAVSDDTLIQLLRELGFGEYAADQALGTAVIDAVSNKDELVAFERAIGNAERLRKHTPESWWGSCSPVYRDKWTEALWNGWMMRAKLDKTLRSDV